jgi:AraC-like DNA-binding protein
LIIIIQTPSAPLCNYVHTLTYYEGLNFGHSIERLLPDGTANLIIELDNIPKYTFDNESLEKKEKYSGAWMSGMQQEYISIGSPPGSSMFVIRFQPGGVYPFLNFPVAELNNLVVDAGLIYGKDVIWLRDQLLEAFTPKEKFGCAEQWLLDHLSEASFSEQVINYAIQQICHDPTVDSIKLISQKTGYSQKQFIQLFKKYVGLSPKYFQRVQRFNKVLQEIERRNEINWPALSYDCGFYDQAHFIREFRGFSGFNPTDFLHEKGEYINYVPIS